MSARETILSNLDITPEDWVLEIGGGPMPFYRSDILADKFLDDDTERGGHLVVDRPVVICDAHYLPFSDHAFDYVFCSQLLEHLDDPIAFFGEIQRVGKKGYIETPNEIREKLFGWPFHKWIVEKKENALLLKKNTLIQQFGLFFHELQHTNYEFNMFCYRNHDLLNTCYEWQEEVDFRFIEEHEHLKHKEVKYLKAKDRPVLKMNGPSKIKRISRELSILGALKRIFPEGVYMCLDIHLKKRSLLGYRHSIEKTKEHLNKVLACPVCKQKFEYRRDDFVECKNCEKRYDIKDGIPILL